MLNKLPKLCQVLVRFSLLLVTVEVLIVREAVAGGIETHEMDIIGPHTSSNASSPRSVHTAQDINKAQSVISQAEGASFFWPCYLIQRRSFCSVAGSGENFVIYGNFVNYSHAARDRLTLAEE